MLAALGLREIRVDYVVVDTLRVPRETFARILEAWRDGYAEAIAELTRFSVEQARAYFDLMIANIRDPNGYAVWLVPAASARVPQPGRLPRLRRRCYLRRPAGPPANPSEAA